MATNAYGSAHQTLTITVSAAPPKKSGYDLVGRDGGVFVFPTGQCGGFYGSLPGPRGPRDDIVGMVPSPTTRATSWSARTAGCSPSATRRSWARCPASGVACTTSWASCPPPTTAATSWWARTAGSSPSATRRSWARCRAGASTSTTSSASPPPRSDNGYWVVAANGHGLRLRERQPPGLGHGHALAGGGDRRHPRRRRLLDRDPERRRLPLRRRPAFGTLPGLGVTPARPVIGLVPTSDDRGYWLIGGTAASSPSATPPSWARCPGSASTSPTSWAPCRPRSEHPRVSTLPSGAARYLASARGLLTVSSLPGGGVVLRVTAG